MIRKFDRKIAAERRAAEAAQQIVLEAQIITQRLKPPVEEDVAVLSLDSPIYTNFVEKVIILELLENYLSEKFNFSEENTTRVLQIYVLGNFKFPENFESLMNTYIKYLRD
jgi:hypothetical protein